MLMPSITARVVAAAAAAAAAVSLAMACPAFAADTEPPPRPTASDPLGNARKLIADKKWAAAIADLKKVNDTGGADWNNLMGYSLRKASTPDLAAAARHYEAALRIDANHRGALEYSGELFLMLGDLAGAEQRMAALTKACGGKCEELDDLKGAIERFKANGNKHVQK